MSACPPALRRFREGYPFGPAGHYFCATLRPDVVVTDLAMPDEDGVWLTEQLHMHGERLPIIVLSGYVDVFEERLKGVRSRQILQKPVDPRQLATAIGDLVE